MDERKSEGSGRGKWAWQIYDSNDRLVFAPLDSTCGAFPVTRDRLLGSSRPVEGLRQKRQFQYFSELSTLTSSIYTAICAYYLFPFCHLYTSVVFGLVAETERQIRDV